jgi:hypothetical protein
MNACVAGARANGGYLVIREAFTDLSLSLSGVEVPSPLRRVEVDRHTLPAVDAIAGACTCSTHAGRGTPRRGPAMLRCASERIAGSVVQNGTMAALVASSPDLGADQGSAALSACCGAAGPN